RVIEIHRDLDLPRAQQRVLQRFVDVDVEHVAEFVWLAVPIGLDARGEIRRVMAAEARLAERPEEIAQRLVAEEVDALLGQVELDVARGRSGDASWSGERLVPPGHLRRRVDLEVTFFDQPLNELI